MKKKTDVIHLHKGTLVKNSTLAYFLNLALLGSAMYSTYLLILSNAKQQSHLFFNGPGSGDTFMDFFNVIKYVSTRDPYHYIELTGLGEKAYPPLSYMLLYPFSRVFDYLGGTPSSAKASQLGIMSLMIFVGASLILIALLLYNSKTGSNLLKSLTVLAMLTSGVYLFTVERANLILIAMPLLAIFLFWYKSESLIKREVAYIALAFATGLKVYPVIFGILLIKDRKWFAAVRTMIYGAVAFFLPFLFFKGGFSNFSQLLANSKLNSLQYQFQAPVFRFGFLPYYLSTHLETTNFKFYINFGNALLVLALVLVLFNKSLWKSTALLTCALIATPINSAYYCGIYLLAPIVLFLNEEEHSIYDLVYVFLFFVILIPYQFENASGYVTNGILANSALLLLYVILLAEAFYRAFSSIISRCKKRPAAIQQIK